MGENIGHSESFTILIHTMLASTSFSGFSRQDRKLALLLFLIDKVLMSSSTNTVYEYLQYYGRKAPIDPFRKAAEDIGNHFPVAALGDDGFGPKASVHIHLVKRGSGKSVRY